jgi:hypothetical protein
MTIFFYLIAAHFLCDFSLQGDAMAREKSRHSKTDLQKAVPWFYWLTAHAFVHGLAVTVITGSVILGILEVFCHWIIDFLKCERTIDIHHDQLYHILSKVTWFAILLTGGV